MKPALLTLAAAVLALLGWRVGGWAAGLAGLNELAPLARAGGALALLWIGERLAARLKL